jgi:hypothetical protein
VARKIDEKKNNIYSSAKNINFHGTIAYKIILSIKKKMRRGGERDFMVVAGLGRSSKRERSGEI